MNIGTIIKLNSLCQALDNMYNVNHGGCCFVASILAKLCDKYNITYQLVIEDSCGYVNDEAFAECVNSRSTESCGGLFEDTCDHYMIAIRGHLINPGGNVNADDCHWFSDITGDDIQWIYENSAWNPVFNTSWKDAIQQSLEIFFNETFKEK